ncbi:hypothetical protein [Nonomuraea rhodomycinica]|uniref:Uncharacterized protein n=1 Tax=Nonomuraea rhodomycinica TaxID=1712872 RepID=A0A7Y6IW84_9ACTN|nr:hypothetical protein [Nonomuraea rhodomycinica]NUW45539.1 hypothetical protein [Nonomuraea rhodomycinica]
MDQRLITGPNELYHDDRDSIDWTEDPDFRFLTEVDALQTLEMLGNDLRAAREQVKHLMRYIRAAAVSARNGTVQDGQVSPQAIINHTKLARQTVYNMIGEKAE